MKVLVVDDESLARERLVRLVGRLHPDITCLEASGGKQALEIVAAEAPDLLLLDIRMPGVDGIEVASRLDELEQPPAIIFCTAYDEYALQALQHHAVAYLLKPVRESDLDAALAGAGRVNRLQLASLRDGAGEDEDAAGAAGDGPRAGVSSQGHRGVEILEVGEVRCFIAEQKYVTAYSADRQLLIPDTLKDLELEFGERFLRVHRNALVSLAHVERLKRDDDGSWSVELVGLEIRPLVSRRHLAQAKAALLGR